MARPLLLDVDTGVDDAIAIALASRLDEHRLIALTTVAGNVPVDVATFNTQRVVAWLGLSVPIYRGVSEPLVRPLYTAREHHGSDGLGGWDVPVEPAAVEAETAPEMIVRLAREHQGEITFACVGPLTNLAVALSLEPRVAEWVERLVVMGGAFFKPGNTTPHAEFNIFADPEAAARIAASDMNVTWVPLDATHQAGLTRDDWSAVSSVEDRGAVLVREVTRRTLTELNRPASYLHDPLAIAVLEEPGIVGTVRGSVSVDVGEHARGRTRVAEHVTHEPQHEVATTVDVQRFRAMLRRVAPSLL